MKWKKIKKLFEPNGDIPWMASHAAVPFLDRMDGDTYRLYFTSRTRGNVSTIGSLVMDTSFTVLEVNQNPVLEHGNLGMFDENGVTASYLVDLGGGRKYLYYVGWNQGKSTPFRNAIGLAISEDGGETFRKYSEGPIVDRSPVDPCFVAGTRVMLDGDLFRMWYISCVSWAIVDGKPRHSYHLKYATSPDGIHWKREGIVAIDFKSEYEYAISQPWVIKDPDKYRMWYSYRAQPSIHTYRIGYAESDDGITWTRMDGEAGIDVSVEGWDSEMICYPYVFDLNGDRYMLYNGNHYGSTGIGLAVLESE